MVRVNDSLQQVSTSKYNTIIKDFNDSSEEDFNNIKQRVANLYNRAYNILVKATNMNSKISTQMQLYTNIKGQWDSVYKQLQEAT